MFNLSRLLQDECYLSASKYRTDSTSVDFPLPRSESPSICHIQMSSIAQTRDTFKSENDNLSMCNWVRQIHDFSNSRFWNLPVAITKSNCYRHPDFSNRRHDFSNILKFPFHSSFSSRGEIVRVYFFFFFVDDVICTETKLSLT